MSRACYALAFLSLLGIGSANAADITIDKFTIKPLANKVYQVEYSGTLKLTDIGGGYEKWDSLTLLVTQGDTKRNVGVVEVVLPTLKENGRFSAFLFLTADTDNKNWTASAQINFLVDDSKQPRSKKVMKAFEAP